MYVVCIVVWRAHKHQHLNVHCIHCLLYDQVQDPTISMCTLFLALAHALQCHCWNDYTKLFVYNNFAATAAAQPPTKSSMIVVIITTIVVFAVIVKLYYITTHYDEWMNTTHLFIEINFQYVERKKKRKKSNQNRRWNQWRRRRKTTIRMSIPFTIEYCVKCVQCGYLRSLARSLAHHHLVNRCFEAVVQCVYVWAKTKVTKQKRKKVKQKK